MLPLKTFLKELNLNDKEIEIYLALLKIGAQAASVVAKKVQIPRSSVFFHLDNLIKKGFVQKEIRANIQYFSALSPHIFHPEVRSYIRDVYVKARKGQKNKAEMIIADFVDSRDYIDYAGDIYSWVGFVEEKNVKFESTIVIYGNKIQFLSTKIEDLTGVLIENKFLANTMKAMFQLLKDSKKIKELS